ncbi:hypothetical protein MOUN0_K02916 [Monosporozyma unispora]
MYTNTVCVVYVAVCSIFCFEAAPRFVLIFLKSTRKETQRDQSTNKSSFHQSTPQP